jgi:hypothetical protein
MKKNNLKRFLASLLAVLMLSQVTGVSPAVFADWNSAATQSAENVAPVFQEYTGEVLIKSGWGNPEILDALATAFVQNKDSVDISAIEWTYKCAVKGTYKVAIDYTTKEAREAEVPVLTGKTVTEDYYYTRLLHAKATYVYPALKDVADGAYELYANGVLVGTIHKVGKLSSAINVNNEVATIAIPYTSGTEYDVNALNESIFNAYVTSTTPAGLTYDKFSYTGTVAEGQQTITISYAGDEDHYGTNAPVTVNFVDNLVEAFSAKEKPENISAGFVKNDANAELTVKNIREALVNQLSDLDLSEVSVGCKSSINALGGYDSLSDTGLKALLLTDTKADIKLTYAGSDTYKPFTAEFKGIKFADNRVASSIAIKEDASITFNMSADNMKQQIFDNVIDWDSENTKLPAKGTLTIADFKFEIGSKDIADKDGYPNLDAGNGQTIKISFVGNSEFKPCNDVKATIDVAKADVKVTMKSFSTAHAGNADELTQEALGVALDPNDPKLDVYMIFAGINTNLDSSVNLVLTKDQQAVVDKISNAQKEIFDLATKFFPDLDIDKTTLKDKLESGITIGQFKEYLNSFIAVIDKIPGADEILNRFGVSIDTIKTMATIFDKLTQFSDDTVIAVGAPKHAGLYTATAVAVNKNYNTGYTSGTVMILMNVKDMKIQLNSNFSKKMTVAEAKALAEDPAGVATLLCGTKPVGNPNLHYLYTGVQSNLKPYSSTTDFPTAPGRYVVTIVTLGGDYLAPPVTKTFQITK